MRLFSAVMAISGFWLIFGGVEMVEISQDWYGMMIGLAVSMMGLVLMGGSALLTAEESPEMKEHHLNKEE